MHSSAEFRRTTKHGVRAGSSTVVVYLALTPSQQSKSPSKGQPLEISFGGPHCGLIVSKKVGNAVTRHRISRVLRHLILPELASLERGHSVVIRALPGIAQASSQEIAQDIAQAMGKCQRKLQRRAPKNGAGNAS